MTPADWISRWQTWAGQFGGPQAGIGGAFTSNPFEQAQAAYRQFVDGVGELMSRKSTAAGGLDINAFSEMMRAFSFDKPGRAGPTDWCSVPLSWADAMLGTAGAASNEQLSELFGAWAVEWLELPAFGPQREWQRDQQNFLKAVLEQQRAAERLNQHFRIAQSLALKRFTAMLQEKDGQPIESLRALYDEWIDVAEQAYRETVMGDQFSRDFGASVNAASRTRKAFLVIQDRVAGILDLATRRDLAAFSEQHARLESEIVALGQKITSLEQRQLTEEAASQPASRQAVKPDHVQKKPPRVARTKKQPARPAARKTTKRRPVAADGEFDIGQILRSAD